MCVYAYGFFLFIRTTYFNLVAIFFGLNDVRYFHNLHFVCMIIYSMFILFCISLWAVKEDGNKKRKKNYLWKCLLFEAECNRNLFVRVYVCVF